jgi:hypothetical protein
VARVSQPRTYDEFVALVGRERYDAACACARDAERIAARDDWPEDLAYVPHDLHAVWRVTELPIGERLTLVLRFLEEMPCYAMTMGLTWDHDQPYTDADRELLWTTFRAALEGDDEPYMWAIGYSLCVDFFENPRTQPEAWREMIRGDGPAWERRVRRVLGDSAAVPWADKERLFGQLYPQRHHHIAIFEAIAFACGNAMANLDRAAALAWLDRLELPPDTPRLDATRAWLVAPPRRR